VRVSVPTAAGSLTPLLWPLFFVAARDAPLWSGRDVRFSRSQGGDRRYSYNYWKAPSGPAPIEWRAFVES
jgi:hypothetical protein